MDCVPYTNRGADCQTGENGNSESVDHDVCVSHTTFTIILKTYTSNDKFIRIWDKSWKKKSKDLFTKIECWHLCYNNS